MLRNEKAAGNLEKIGGGVPERGEGAAGGDHLRSLHGQLLVPDLDARELHANPACP